MLLSIVSVITIIANTVIGVTIFSRAPKETSNQRFGLLSLAIVGWVTTFFFYSLMHHSSSILFFSRLNLFFAAFIPPSIFAFVLTFPKRIVKLPRWFEISVILYSIIVALLTLTPFVDKNELIKNSQHITVFGPLYSFYISSLVGVSFLSIAIVIYKFNKASYLAKVQLQYLILAFVSLTLILVVFNGVLPYFFKITLLDSFGSLGTIVFLGFISYAIVRHRFMDINQFAAGAGVYTTSIIAIGIVYSVIAFVIGKLFFPRILSIRYIIFTVLFMSGFKYAITPVRKYFWNFTNRIFYRNTYNREEFFNTISSIIVSSFQLDILVEKILKTFCVRFGMNHALFIAREEKKQQAMVFCIPKKYKCSLQAREMRIFDSISKITHIDEISNKSIRQTFQKKDIQFIVPINLGRKRKGLFCLGRKSSGGTYSIYDIRTFELILPVISIAFQNAISVEKIKQFNASLKNEVDKSTKKLVQTNERLRYADRLKDEFISIASHELKTPTTAIQGFLWLVLKKDKNLSPYSKEKLEKVAKLTQHMTALVNDMLDVSKIESKRISLYPEIFDIEKLVEEIKGELDVLAIEKHIDIRIKKSKSRYSVWADKQRAHQIVANLLSNAVKYSKEGGNIEVKFKKTRNKKLKVLIKDNGIGIRKEDFPKLFTKFGKLEGENYINYNLPGTGLGLYITKNLVELSGGNIDVTSTYGKGSTFTFSLPAQ